VMGPAEEAKRPYLTLRELSAMVRSALAAVSDEIWVAAEILRINVHPQSGHCYLELAERDEEALVAQMKAVIWAGIWRTESRRFETETGRQPSAGMKLLMRGRVSYHDVYGLSFNVLAIDPRFTLGEIALQRRKTIERLEREGLLDRNRSLPIADVIQRIAVISSENAAGYGDFLGRLRSNPHGYSFALWLYQTQMQGERAESALCRALQVCRAHAQRYDAVVIIRGGGSQADLQVFDSYAIAREIATMPVPVLTGIGHLRDAAVGDRVAHHAFATPTALADFIVNRAAEFEDRLSLLGGEISGCARELLGRRWQEIVRVAQSAEGIVRDRLARSREQLAVSWLALGRDARHLCTSWDARMEMAAHRLVRAASAMTAVAGASLQAVHARCRRASAWCASSARFRMRGVLRSVQRAASAGIAWGGHLLEKAHAQVLLLDPKAVLRRGYSITRAEGRCVTDAAQVAPGIVLDTVLWRGRVISRAERTLKGEDDEGRGEDDISQGG